MLGRILIVTLCFLSNALGATPISPSAEERARQGLGRQKRLYSELELAAERRSMRTEADVGGLARVLNTAALSITAVDTGYQFRYEDGFVRAVTPRPGGPIYTAKGDEFIADELGRSMVYWRGTVLVIETLLAPRGRMTEEIMLTPGRKSGAPQLEIHTELENPDWLI
ncbi:MAG: hypothetical protein ACREXT_00040, partial [Gammaproteobacteria bacterium]